MKNPLLIFAMWRYPLSVLAAFATMAFIFLWPSLPLHSVMNWLRFFYYYTPQNYLYGAMTLIAGLYAGVYVYQKKVARTCPVDNLNTSTTGGVIGMLLGACPACIPALAFFLPLSVTIVLSRLSMIFLVLSVGIMLFSLWRVGGFKKAHGKSGLA